MQAKVKAKSKSKSKVIPSNWGSKRAGSAKCKLGSVKLGCELRSGKEKRKEIAKREGKGRGVLTNQER
jgi:hypothetical protein